MIYKGTRQVEALYKGGAIGAVYKGARLVWEAITSCFGSGMWMNLRVWKDTDGWKN